MIRKLYNERQLIIRFFIVGFCGFVVNYAVLRVATTNLHYGKILGEVVAAAVALQVTFFLNDHWTYRLENKASHLNLSLRARYFAYIATNSFGSLMTVVMFGLFSQFLDRLLALATSAMAAMVWNYVMNRVFIWRRSAGKAEAE